MSKWFEGRFFALHLSWIGAVALAAWQHGWISMIGAPLFFVLFLIGIRDIRQSSQAIRRNYPIISHQRFFLEFIRPEIRQYFLEDDTTAAPYARVQRSIVYQRAKPQTDKSPFGTQMDVYRPGHEWLNHSMAPAKQQPHDFRVVVGERRPKLYSMSVLNISAMSFGALSANAIMALNRGAKMGGFAHDTGEGSISRYHCEHGGDLVWNIGSGYFVCRTPEGKFSPEKFVANANTEQVRLIEIKLSQGAKP